MALASCSRFTVFDCDLRAPRNKKTIKKKVVLEFVGSEQELETEAFRMASGGDANWKVVRDEGLREKFLGVIEHWLEAQDLGEKDLCSVTEAQPLRLKLLRRLLEVAGNPDKKFLRSCSRRASRDTTRYQGLRMSPRSS